MNPRSLVSVVMIFMNAEKYVVEAIESVIAQTYTHWELLLIDDGSTDTSTNIAKDYARRNSNRVYYLDHPGHSNQGKGASRNLGLHHAKGDYVAFLDADDVWLPHKLQEQVSLLDKYENVGMLYGKDLYWYSWTNIPADGHKDFMPLWGTPLDVPIQPPALLPQYIRGRASIPCPSGILARRSAVCEVGGFDESFMGIQNIYEDQAFFAKLCLKTPIMIVDQCWNKYRQHSQASMAVAERTGTEVQARSFFLAWLEGYLQRQQVQDNQVWHALKQAQWLIQKPRWLPDNMANGFRWMKKWLLRIGESVLPARVHHQLWK